MAKLIGSIFILASCSAFGFLKSNELKEHVRELEGLKKVFTLLRYEVEYTGGTFPEVFKSLSKKIEEGHGRWLRDLALDLEKRREGTLQDAWEKAVRGHFRDGRLRGEELSDLIQVGKDLGSVDNQELYLRQLDLAILHTREEFENKKKLYQSLGIMGGIFLVIVLL